MPITIKDVAKAAGVSPITASRALNGSHPVAEATRRKVLAATEELGYVPDLVARGLVRRTSSIIGLVVTQLSNPFFTPIVDTIQATVQDQQRLLIVNQSQRSLDMERACLRQLQQMRVAGVLIVPISPQRDHLAALKRAGIPVVAIARQWSDGDYVTVDDVAGGRLMGEHLVRLGHCRIGYVALDEAGHMALQDRLIGFHQALHSVGCDTDPRWRILTKTLTLQDGQRAADCFLELTDRPTAVFCTGDQLAIGFLARVQERGLRVPDDVAVVGYDDIPYAEFLDVPLTTVALPKVEMGQRAAQILFDRIAGAQPPDQLQQILLPPTLVVRASCGAAPRTRPLRERGT